MTHRSTRAKLIARLRAGPLHSDDFAEVTASRGSLKVRIHALRAEGFTITSTAARRPTSHQRGRPAVEYRLVAEPAALEEAA